MSDFRSTEQIKRDALLEELQSLLGACTPAQRAMHERLVESGRAAGRWPNGVDSMSIPALEGSIRLCQRTLRKERT
jgi:hypothetical protein